jgi:hypothetical protein
MPITFPANPITNQTFSAGDKLWVYNGRGWFGANTQATITVDTTTIKKLDYGLNILLD